MDDRLIEFYTTIGARIRDYRIKAGMNQADLAAKSGLSVSAISDIENAHSRIWLFTFAKVAEALGTSADDILRLSTPPATDSYPQEFQELLNNCDSSEIEAILRISRQVKATFDKQKKDLLD